MTTTAIEERLYKTTVSIEERAEADGGGTFFEGEGIVYDQPSRPLYDSKKGAFIEVIEAGAVDADTDTSEVLAVFNHDENRLLGANYSGTLVFNSTKTGVSVRIEKPDNTVGNDCEVWVRRGDIRGMSFKFKVGKDRWEQKDGLLFRYISKISHLLDLSLVTRAAYVQTSIDMAAAPVTRSAYSPEIAESRMMMSGRSAKGTTGINDTDKTFLDGMIGQFQGQIEFISQAIPTLTDNRIKELAASRLSGLIYSQNWFEEVKAELETPPAQEVPEMEPTEIDSARSADEVTTETGTEERSASPKENTQDHSQGDPLAWYKAKNKLHYNSLQSCR